MRSGEAPGNSRRSVLVVLGWLLRGILGLLLMLVLAFLSAVFVGRIVKGYWFDCEERPIRSLEGVVEILEAGPVIYDVDSGSLSQRDFEPTWRFEDHWIRCSERGLAQMSRNHLVIPTNSILPVRQYEAVFERWSPELLRTIQDGPTRRTCAAQDRCWEISLAWSIEFERTQRRSSTDGSSGAKPHTRHSSMSLG